MHFVGRSFSVWELPGEGLMRFQAKPRDLGLREVGFGAEGLLCFGAQGLVEF